MKIWVVTQHYVPEPGAAAARLGGMAQAWKGHNQQVTIFSGLPTQNNGAIHEDYVHTPAFIVEEFDNITVRRHWQLTGLKTAPWFKNVSALSFAFTVLFKNLNRAQHERPDVVIGSSPSFFGCISAWLLAKRYKVPFVLEVRELWPSCLAEAGELSTSGNLYKFFKWLEKRLYLKAQAIVTISRGQARTIHELGIDAQKIFVIQNGVLDHEIDIARAPLTDGSVDKLRTELQISPLSRVVLYLGTHGQMQALGQIIDAARLLMNRSDILFLLAGEGPDKERLKKIARGMPNVQFVPAAKREKLWAFYNLAYLCLVPLRDTPAVRQTIPSKIFDILAAGKPIIGCLEGEAVDVLNSSNAALVVPPEDPERLAKAVLTLVDAPERVERMGNAGRVFVAQHFKHSMLAKHYLAVLQHAIKNNK